MSYCQLLKNRCATNGVTRLHTATCSSQQHHRSGTECEPGGEGVSRISRSCRLTQPPSPIIRDQNFVGINSGPSSKREKRVITQHARIRPLLPRRWKTSNTVASSHLPEAGGGERKRTCYTMTASYISADRNITT